MKKNIYILALIAAIGSVFATNGVYTENTESVTAWGVGETENAALYYALNNAVTQVNGISIESDTDVINVVSSNQTYFPPLANNSLLITGKITRETVDRSFEGYIKGFKVLSSEKQDDSNIKVTVEAEVYKYKHPAADTTDKRVRIVVNDFKQAAGTLEISERLEAAINNGLTSTDKFNVLERTYIRDFATERNIMLSDDASMADKARLAMVYGSDFMISGTIREFRLESALRDDMKSKRKLPLYEANVEVEYRLIIPATLQTRISDTVEFKLSPQEVNALWEKTTPADLELDITEVKKAIAAKVADKIVDAVTEKIYPVLVAYIQGDIIYLNEGGKRISEGDIFDVLNKGPKVADPQTGLSLGNTMDKTATIKVDVVADRMSFAKVISGDISKIKVGDACLKQTSMAEGKQASTPPTGATLDGQPILNQNFVQKVEAHKAKNFKPAKLAVLPLKFTNAKSTYLNQITGSREIASKFDQYLITALSKTGKFELLDRDYQADYSKEIQLILDSSPIEEILPKLDMVSAADYIVVGRLESFSVTKDSKYVEAASITSTRYNAQIRLEYRIIDLATRKIAHSDQMDIILDDEQLKSLIPNLATSTDREIGESQIKYTLISMAAGNVTEQLINELFPILVVAVSGNDIAISAGSDILIPGQEVYIFKRGEAMKDPYTGQEIGTFDSQSAIARVTRTEASIAYADIITGEAKVGYVCKASKEIEEIPTGLKKTDMKVTPSGGVYLPMD